MKVKRYLNTSVILLILTFIAVCTTTSSADAQSVHALLIILGNDRNIRSSVEKNESSMQTLLRQVSKDCEVYMTVMKSETETIGKITRLTLSNAHATNIKEQKQRIISAKQVVQWLNNLSPSGEDTILVYYSGHGSMDAVGTHILNFDPEVTNDFVARNGLRNQLEQKLGRLKMLITDTCSNRVQTPPPIAHAYAKVRSRERRYTKNLFLEHSGLLDITAASSGEYAWGNDEIGGYFTISLIGSFTAETDTNQDRFLSWSEVFDATRDKTQTLFSETIFRTIDKRRMKDIGQTTQTPTKKNPLPARLIQTEAFDVLSPTAHIAKVWVDHNKFENNIKGMRIHVKFEVDNFKGQQGRVVAYFYKKNGDPLKDTNKKYKTTTGNVSVGRNFQPSYVNAIYKDYTLFFPYSELHLPAGKHSLKFYIRIFNPNTGKALSAKSNWLSFTYTAPEARVLKVWVDYDKFENNIKGMRIHVKFEVDNFKGQQGRVNAYFYKKNGAPLKDTNKKYKTTAGNVSVGRNFQPSYVNAIYKDYTLFFPYSELHLPAGKHSLKFHIQIFNPNTRKALSAISDPVHMNFTR